MANTVIGASVEIEFQSVGGLRKAIKDATSELIQMQEKFGMSSKEAVAAASKVAELKDRIRDAREQADLFDPGKKFQAFVNIGSTIAAGFSAIQGAMALVGSESENVQKAMMKLQGAMALAQGLSQLKEFGKAWDGLKGFINKAVTSMNTFQKAMAGLGIGILIAVVAAWDDIAQALGFAKKQSEDYTAAQKAGNEALADARAKVTEVGAAFRAAEKDTNLKEAALKTYNDRLGESIGRANTLEEAEKLYRANTAAYLQAVKARAIAQEAFARGAKLMVDYEQGLAELGVTSQEVENRLKATGKTAEEFANETFRASVSLEGAIFGTNEADVKLAQALILKSKQDEANQLNKIAEDQLIIAQQNENKYSADAESRNKKHHETKVNTAKTSNDKQTKIEQQGEEARRLIQETSFKLMSEKDAELEKLRLQNIQNINKLEVAGFKENSKERLDLKIAYENERAAIEKKYQDEADKKQKEYQDKLNAIELETRMAGITNVREKEIQELKNTYAEKLKEIETNENYNQQQREALITALTTQQQQAEKALNEKFRQEDIKAEADKLKEIASNEKLSFNERITALKAQLDLTNQMTFESEDARRDYIQNINNQIDAINKESHDKKIADLNQLLDLTLGVLSTLRQANDTDLNTKKQQYDQDQKNLQRMLNNKEISEEQYAAKRKKLDEEQNEVLKKSFKRNQIIAIAEAIMNTAKGVTNALGSLPPPFSFIQAAATALLGGLQVNMIKKQKPDLIESGSISIGGGGGGGTAPIAPALSTAIQGQALNAEAINNLSNQAVRAYVMNSDIQNNDQRNAYLQRNARLG